MQFTASFILAAAFAFSSINAKCYSGLGWGAEKGLAEQAVDALCDPTKLNSFIHDGFQQGQTKADCVQLSGNKKADFQVNWGGQGYLNLAQEDCVLRFKNEVNGCGSGGSTTTADWTFTADPNDGTCVPVEKRSVKFMA
ncbi:hypothetical protein F5B22DRAFT_584157 [Xylaria bambusicola]|uniref:uncharacterized protein n=1 Tax=Xylaria bambusicola TaxID=326684 RepID=UPI002007934C|nr:uncharacterized protein F5B22DRAFT_584157 [Xylaria bambusicola]KAI0528203.1 hypothetical protein F5B22DRAFT_584157 [Xylaria bambusicola]